MTSFKFNNTYINDYYTLAGPYEKKGRIKNYNQTFDDLDFNTKCFEDAEIKMQKEVFNSIQKNNGLNNKEIDLVIGGDLLNQITISTMAFKESDISFLGIYSACATFVEELILFGSLIDSKKIKKGVSIVSSHNLTSERQFRYPIEYGSPKLKTVTFTVTGAVCALISNEVSNIKLESCTIGKIVDKGVNDVFNMGAVMAPAVADTLYEHLKYFNRSADYYDLILTGDIGEVGINILKEYYDDCYGKEINNIIDAGTLVYKKNQNTFSGASGPAVLPLVLFTKIVNEKKYQKVLIIGTGSLHSTTLVNQKNTIPSIAHAISLEIKR